MKVRESRPGERVTVRSIFDAALLEVPDLDATQVLVAADGERVVGALAVASGGDDGVPGGETAEILAVAVRPGRRGGGLGTALVETAAERHDTLVAGFESRVRPFYEALGFEIDETDAAERLWGVRGGTP